MAARRGTVWGMIFGIGLLPVPVLAGELGLLGTASAVNQLTAEERAAYDWAVSEFPSRYVALEDLATSPGVLEGLDVLWWHLDESTTLPSAATSPATIGTLTDFTHAGGGMLLSGFAPQYVLALGLEDTPPSLILRDPSATDNWGFKPIASGHPVFAGFTGTVYTVTAGLSASNNICWWNNPSTFDGRWLADTEWSGNLVVLGEYSAGAGRVLIVGTGAFEWDFGVQVNSSRGNLERLTANMIEHARTPRPEPGLLAHWKFDEGNGKSTREEVSATSDLISDRLGSPDWLIGPSRTSLRFDGYTTWMEHPGSLASEPLDGLTVEAWVAVFARPVEEAGIVHLEGDNRGFFLGLNRLGQVVGRVKTAGGTSEIRSALQIPSRQWVHVAMVFDSSSGLQIYLNGQRIEVASSSGQPLVLPAASTYLGRSANPTLHIGWFPLNVFSGALDEVKIHGAALEGGEIRDSFEGVASPGVPRLEVPERRVISDQTRPRYHPIPAGNWTNEPHGFIFWKGRYHLFHQANPNGPYFYLQRWGHMVSSDLLHWESLPLAIEPGAGADWNGVWSGDAIVLGDSVAAVYTSNGDAQTQSVAFASDELLLDWRKAEENPVTGAFPPGVEPSKVAGFRDPFVWRDGEFHFIVVGSGVIDEGGFLTLYRSRNLTSWEYRGVFYGRTDVEKTGWMWEMPSVVPLSETKTLLIINTIPTPAKPLYWIGEIVDEEFVPDHDAPKLLDIGLQLLSPSIAMLPDGRHVGIGVVRGNRSAAMDAEQGWANLFGLPRVFGIDEQERLTQEPASELEALRGNHRHLSDLTVAPGTSNHLAGLSGNQLEFVLDIEMGDAELFGMRLLASENGLEQTRLTCSRDGILTIDRTDSSFSGSVEKGIHSGPHALDPEENLQLHIYVDRSVITVFANGRSVLTTVVFPTQMDAVHFDFYTQGGTAVVHTVDVWDVRSTTFQASKSSGWFIK